MWILNDAIKPKYKRPKIIRASCLLDHVDIVHVPYNIKIFSGIVSLCIFGDYNPLSTTQCGISNYGGLWWKSGVAANKQKPINYMRLYIVATREIGWKQKKIQKVK